jgi:hypothetical protein
VYAEVVPPAHLYQNFTGIKFKYSMIFILWIYIGSSPGPNGQANSPLVQPTQPAGLELPDVLCNPQTGPKGGNRPHHLFILCPPHPLDLVKSFHLLSSCFRALLLGQLRW